MKKVFESIIQYVYRNLKLFTGLQRFGNNLLTLDY